MKTIVKLSFSLAAILSLALGGVASAHDGGHHGGFGGHGYGGHGYYGHGYYHHGGLLFGVGFYPGYYGYPYGFGYGYPYPYYPPYAEDAYRGEVVGDAPAHGSMESDVQQALAEKGYYRGKIDGVVGPGTRAAIRDYQQDKGLAVTGRINSGLVKSLDLD